VLEETFLDHPAPTGNPSRTQARLNRRGVTSNGEDFTARRERPSEFRGGDERPRCVSQRILRSKVVESKKAAKTGNLILEVREGKKSRVRSQRRNKNSQGGEGTGRVYRGSGGTYPRLKSNFVESFSWYTLYPSIRADLLTRLGHRADHREVQQKKRNPKEEYSSHSKCGN